MTTAFVLWGGGSLGAAQVGMLRSLTSAGVRPDIVLGTSVGAINGVCYAAAPSEEGVECLAQAWEQIGQHDVFPRSVSESLRVLLQELPWSPLRGAMRALGAANHVFPLNPATLASALMGRSSYLIDSGRFGTFLHRVLPVERLEHTEIPVEVLATDLSSGESVPMAEGPAVSAVMASSAIPAVYPHVVRDGRALVDGEVANGTCLDRAVRLGADEVYLLSPGPACSAPLEPPTSVLGTVVHAYHLLSQQRLAAAIAQMPAWVRVHAVPPPVHAPVLPADFTHTRGLIETAAEVTSRWLHNHQVSTPPVTEAAV